MPLAVDSEMAAQAADGVGGVFPLARPRTFSFNNVSGTLLLAAVGISDQSTDLCATLAAPTYDGVAMTLALARSPIVTGGNKGGIIGVYYQLLPSTGSKTFSYTWTDDPGNVGGNQGAWAACISFTGNDPTTPVKQSNSGGDDGTQAATFNATLAGVTAGNITFAVAGGGGGASGFTTQTQTLSAGFNNANTSMGSTDMTRSAGSGSVVHGFTQNGADHYAWIVVEVAAPSSPPPPGGDPPQPQMLVAGQGGAGWA